MLNSRITLCRKTSRRARRRVETTGSERRSGQWRSFDPKMKICMIRFSEMKGGSSCQKLEDTFFLISSVPCDACIPMVYTLFQTHSGQRPGPDTSEEGEGPNLGFLGLIEVSLLGSDWDTGHGARCDRVSGHGGVWSWGANCIASASDNNNRLVL